MDLRFNGQNIQEEEPALTSHENLSEDSADRC